MDPPIIEIKDMDLSQVQTEKILNLLKTDEKYMNIKSNLEKPLMIKDSYTNSNESLFLKIFACANPKLTECQIDKIFEFIESAPSEVVYGERL